MQESKGKLYLAAPWIERHLMDERAKQFEDVGYEITHKWWYYEQKGPEDEKTEFLRECGRADFHGVCTSNVVIVFNTAKSEGKAVEQGIALGRGIPLVCIGKQGEFSNNVFHYMENFQWVSNIKEAIEEVDLILGGTVNGE